MKSPPLYLGLSCRSNGDTAAVTARIKTTLTDNDGIKTSGKRGLPCLPKNRQQATPAIFANSVSMHTDSGEEPTECGNEASLLASGRLDVPQQQPHAFPALPVVDRQLISGTQATWWRSTVVGIEHHSLVHEAVAWIA